MRVIKYNINASNIVAIQIFAKYVDQHTCMFIYTHSQCMPCHTYNILIYNKIITRSGYLNINIDRESSIRINTQTQNQSINTYIGCLNAPEHWWPDGKYRVVEYSINQAYILPVPVPIHNTHFARFAWNFELMICVPCHKQI